jgi:hypothetical protein
VLRWTIQRYRSVALVEQALGMSRAQLDEMAVRLLGHGVDHWCANVVAAPPPSFSRIAGRQADWIDHIGLTVQRGRPADQPLLRCCSLAHAQAAVDQLFR